VWDKLGIHTTDETGPGYLQLLTLISVHCFYRENVDLAVYEVHAGGLKDSTNIFDRPVACGFSTIGLDHADRLGGSIRSIAEHKSGIMKRQCPSYSVIQPEATARSILLRQAAELECPIEFVEISKELPKHPNIETISQQQNASLAVRLANAYLKHSGAKLDDGDIDKGLELFSWPGRFQTFPVASSFWYLDIAHNQLSLPVALAWFHEKLQAHDDSAKQHSRRVLIFGHESRRDASELIALLAIFCRREDLRWDLIILSPYKRYGRFESAPQIPSIDNLKVWKFIIQQTTYTRGKNRGLALKSFVQATWKVLFRRLKKWNPLFS
jgi:folylpolyglutamate synthase